jgi:hypothetical protein
MGLPDKCKTCENFAECNKQADVMAGPLFDDTTSVHKKLEELATMYLMMTNPKVKELMLQHEKEINEILATVNREQQSVVASRIVGISNAAVMDAVLGAVHEAAGGGANA